MRYRPSWEEGQPLRTVWQRFREYIPGLSKPEVPYLEQVIPSGGTMGDYIARKVAEAGPRCPEARRKVSALFALHP